MRYENLTSGCFLCRENRFVAKVLLEGGEEEAVHVKNTGRLKELLLPGARVVLTRQRAPGRKTAYDLIGAYREGKLYNLDSQAPNRVVGEWLAGQGFSLIRPEYTYRDSRLDFYLERGQERYLLEVKGCTLEREGVGYFPDAPTQRGIRHLNNLSLAAKEGYRAFVAFVIQMEGVTLVKPNEAVPAFGLALGQAREAGVGVAYLPCYVREGELSVREWLGESLF